MQTFVWVLEQEDCFCSLVVLKGWFLFLDPIWYSNFRAILIEQPKSSIGEIYDIQTASFSQATIILLSVSHSKNCKLPQGTRRWTLPSLSDFTSCLTMPSAMALNRSFRGSQVIEHLKSTNAPSSAPEWRNVTSTKRNTSHFKGNWWGHFHKLNLLVSKQV